MNKPISEMDKQLQATDSFSIGLAIASNNRRRNACLFYGIVVLALIMFFAWNKWLLLIPAALGLGAILSQANSFFLSSELKRRL
jgi:hypothetical protein